MEVEARPQAPKPGQEVDLFFRVVHPKTGKAVKNFEIIHEKLLHLFIVSEDLTHFAHEHPEPQDDGSFRFRYRFPHGGIFRLLTDFYPKNATPQLVTQTIVLPGAWHPAALKAGAPEQQGENLRVRLRTEPSKPIAGMKTLLFFDLDPADGLQPYLGAWGHLLMASEDSIDMVHAHPAFEDAGKTIQFNLIFPRPGMHRLWVQFQREGRISTVAFNVSVLELQ